jgi:cell division protein FtsQ
VPAGPRLEERARAERATRRRRRLRHAGQALLVLLPLAAVAWVVLASTWLAVDRVAVTGTGRVTTEAVVQAAAVAPGTPLARVDTRAVEDRISALPPVADVAVRRTWPGTLTVEVTERTPAAAVPSGSGVTLVDASGVLFGGEPAQPPGVVRLEVADPGPEDPATRAALEVSAALPDALRSRVTVVQAPSPSGVRLVLADGREVVWGRPGGTATKAAAVLALLDRPGTVFDVSGEGVVVVR